MTVVQVDLDDTIGSSDLADELGLPRSVMSNWIRRHADFPDPILTIGVHRFYSRRAVLGWLTGSSHLAGILSALSKGDQP